MVRLIVLYQWRFTSWPDTSFEFETILESLNGRDASAGDAAVEVPDPMLRIPSPPVFAGADGSQAVVQDMLASGYLPHAHVTRVAPPVDPGTVQTVSWYSRAARAVWCRRAGDRRPLDERADAGRAGDLLGRSTAPLQSRRSGCHNVSSAAAWQLGQLLALTNRAFAVALQRWRQQAALQLRAHAERDGLDAFYVDRERLLRYLARRSG